MDVLKHLPAALAALVALLPACYEPQWQDCAVRCSSSDDCAPGQACGAQGYCAAPDRTCTPAAPDAPPGDGRKPDDKPKVQLRVRLSDGGRVVVDGAGACDTTPPRNGDCHFPVTAGVQQTVSAIPHTGYVFDRWISQTCSMAGASCVVLPLEPLTEVRARFERMHGASAE